ncbi:MAG: hypothetical protein ACI9G1_002873 [Pirellulaceae bacterium]|jgi:hypothetical protein
MSTNPYQTPNAMADKSGVVESDPQLDRAAEMLRQTKPWVRFMSVMMFIGSAFMVLAGLGMIITSAYAWMPGNFVALMGAIYIVMALLYIVPAIFLWKYASQIAIFLGDRSASTLASALESQKSFWKFVGVVMLVIIILYGVGIIFAIVLALISGGAR